MADGQQAIERIREKFPAAVLDSGSYMNQAWVRLDPDSLIEICAWLRDEPDNAYDYLVDVTAAHWPEDEDTMEVIYHLQSYRHDDRLRLKVRSGPEGPLPSLSELWRSAEWNERETYDMFGIRFEGHPDLRRILMPDDYTDFPLRKEFPLYRG